MTEYINKKELLLQTSIPQYLVEYLDTVNVVRCKDCKHRQKDGYCITTGDAPPDDFFCRKGEEE